MRFTAEALPRGSAAVASMASWTTVIVLGGIQTYASRFSVNADGISYLSLGELYARGDWGAAVNAYWSPAYPFLLGMLRLLVPVSDYWEAPLAHVLNFLLLLTSFATFRFFLKELQRSQRRRMEKTPGASSYLVDFSRPAEIFFAHALFLWSALGMIGLWHLTPDMLVACIVYALGGLMLRLRSQSARPACYGLVGLMAALGYLAKTVMFPLGILVVVACALQAFRSRSGLTRPLFAAGGFLLASAPQIIAESRLTGRVSYGETGTVAYAQYVNGFPQWWTGMPPGSGTPKHPVRVVHDNPPAYAFASGQRVFSYPYRDQPAYWAEGIRPRFDIKQQLEVTTPIIALYLYLLFPLLVVTCVLFVFREKAGPMPYLELVLPAVGAFGLYALVYAEPRYLGPWTSVLFLSLVAAPALRVKRRRAVDIVLVAVAVFNFLVIASQLRTHISRGLETVGDPEPHKHFYLASALKTLGLEKGDVVASIGRSYEAYWARLGRVQIAMEIPDAKAYWSAADSVKRVIHRRFAENGAKGIITNEASPDPGDPGWVRIGTTDHYFRPLP